MSPNWQLTTEVNIFTSSKDFQQKPSICEPALQIVMEHGAHSPCYYGAQIEVSDPTIGYNFVHWNSEQDHMNVTDDAAVFPSLQKALFPSLHIPPTIKLYHIRFSNDPKEGFTAPFTEVTSLLLQKSPFLQGRKDVEGLLSQIADKVGKQFVYGSAYEDGNRFIVICGQLSKETSWVTDANLVDLTTKLFELAPKAREFSDTHTKLASCAKAA